MARDAARSELALAQAGFVSGWASETDDMAIRQLLRDTPMAGRFRVSLEREPSFFGAARIEGDRHRTAVVREPASGQILAMCTRSVRNAYVNGEIVRLGYLSQLRIAPTVRSRARTLLRAGFNRMRTIRAEDEMPFDITAIIADNHPARRLLEAGLPGLPRYRPLEPFLTLMLPVRKTRRSGATTIARGDSRQVAEILACLDRSGRRHQFAPHWTARHFPMPGLALEQFRVAMENNRVIGCMALWDQRAFKQAVVRGYEGALNMCRPLLNLFGARLPAEGTALPFAHVSHVAVDDDDPDVFVDLLTAVLADAREVGCRWLAVGAAARHPWAGRIRRIFRPHQYESILYAVHEPDREVGLDTRVPQVEVALL